MPRYEYTAQTSNGECISSAAEARSLPELAATLASRGESIVSARERSRMPVFAGSVPHFELVSAYRQIAGSIEAGLPLAETLSMLASESRNARIRSLMYALATGVAEGVPLSEAMQAIPDVFPRVHVAAIRAGEESGRLEEALNDLAEQAEAFSNMNRRIASALVYPTVISFAALSLLGFGMLSFVPKWKQLFGDLGIVDIGTVPKLAFFIANTMFPIFGLIMIGAIITSLLVLTQRRAARGLLWFDRWKLRVPGVGQIVEKAAMARFSGTLGLLLHEGVALPDAVRLASEGAGNGVVERLLKNAAAQVELGKSLSDAMSKTDALPQTVQWRIGVGEETGTLPEALTSLSKLYASQVDNLVTSLAGLLEPLLIVVLGTGVATLVVGMFLPLVAVIQNLSGG